MTNPTESKHRLQLFVALALATLMILTRGDLLGSAVALTLHDASWAVFLLGGLLLRKASWLAVFAVLALALDLAALCGTTFNLASCLRPSYATLVLTWIALWTSGSLLTQAYAQRRWPLVGIGAVAATAAALLISNGGFYLWSGFFTDQTLAGFVAMAKPHALTVFTTTLVYFFVGLSLLALKSFVDNNTQTARIEP